ncbi:MAG: O-antigen translocase [Butyricimonas virosa]|nr:O-antigen translocase [Butyricimonas virosa]
MGEVINKFFSHCKRVAKADIVKVFSFTVVSTLVKMLTGLISVKVVASVIGPAGIALLGQLNNFTVIVMTLANGGINNGIVKYIAEYKEDRGKVIVFLSTALRITLFCSLIIGLFMILFHTYLSKVIMLSSEYGYVFTVFGLTVLMYSLNMMLISVINGFKEFRMYVKISIANSVVGVLFTLVFVYTLGLKGALISAVTYQSVMLCVTFLMVRKLPWVDWEYFKKKLNILVGKKYFRYSLMTLVTTTIVPISQMFLRGYVISEISVVEAGWWEGMNRISNMYLMVITSSFSVYYLPRLSELTDEIELRREIFKAYSVIMPMLLIGFSLVYFLRHFIISMLFTPDFYPMENLFLWQLLGDFFKICSWLLAFLMIAKSMMKTFIFTEIIFAGTFVGMSLLLIQSNGIIGITQAYVGNYILYLITMFFIFRKMLSIKKR